MPSSVRFEEAMIAFRNCEIQFHELALAAMQEQSQHTAQKMWEVWQETDKNVHEIHLVAAEVLHKLCNEREYDE